MRVATGEPDAQIRCVAVGAPKTVRPLLSAKRIMIIARQLTETTKQKKGTSQTNWTEKPSRTSHESAVLRTETSSWCCALIQQIVGMFFAALKCSDVAVFAMLRVLDQIYFFPSNSFLNST